MQRRNDVQHNGISKINKAMKDMAPGVSDALEKVKELNESEMEEHFEKTPILPEIRDLVLFGKVIEDFNIGGYKFKISTLTNRQQKELVKKLMKLDDENRLADVQVLTLTEAIISINDVQLEDLFSGSEQLSVDEKKYEVISELQSGLVNRLFSLYESLVKKSNKFFTEGDLNKEIKN